MKINSWWNKNSKREKILAMVTVALLVIIVAEVSFIQPLEKKQKEYRKNIQAGEAERIQFLKQIEMTQQLLAVSSKTKLDKQQQSLQQQIEKQKERLSKLTDNLIPPEQMAVVIEQLLKQRGSLKLLSLVNMEPEGLPDNEKQTEVETASLSTVKNKRMHVQKHAPLIYRHPLQLKFRGRYFQVMEYLKALENSEHNFYWEQLDYNVDKYPYAEVSLKLSTLGTESQWMGASSNHE